ncbi:MAG: lysostaphin resistance A-like protein [Planctomycetota bacterium]
MRFGIIVGLAPALVLPIVLWRILEGVGLYHPFALWFVVLPYHAYCYAIPRLQAQGFRDAGFTAGNWRRWMFWCVVYAGAILVGAYVLEGIYNSWVWSSYSSWSHSGYIPAFRQAALGAIGVFSLMHPLPVFLLYGLTLAPFVEEFFWRGFLQEKTGIVVSALLFWLSRLTVICVLDPFLSAYISTAWVFGLGLLNGWLRRKYGSLWPCVILHVVTNGAAILILITRLSAYTPWVPPSGLITRLSPYNPWMFPCGL